MSGGTAGGDEITTIGQLMEGLAELARMLPEGMETPVELGICDGSGLQLVDNADVGHWGRVSSGEGTARDWFVLVRGHVHPGEKPGRYLPGVMEDLDRDLRDLLGEEGGREG